MPNLRGKTWTTTTPANVEDAQYWEDHLISDTAAAKAASSVQSVNSITPDQYGNVEIGNAGHTIQDDDGNDMPKQDVLQFVNADVTNDTVNEKTVVDCKGAKGDAATITVGTVTTLPAGSDATVTNSGTSHAAVFNFGIPKGADGTGSVDSVNGYTGTVVLDASDVGALPDSTTIPTKTSELDNDSGFVTSSAIPTSLSELSDDSTHRLVTDAEKTAWDAKVSETLLKDTVGWVGKNKTPYPYQDGASKVSGNVTFTVDSEGVINANASADVGGFETYTVMTAATLNALLQKYGDLILSRSPEGTSGSTFQMYTATSGGYILVRDEEVTLLKSNTYTEGIVVQIIKNATAAQVSNVKFKPMLRPASIADSTYEPYHKSVEDWYWENNPNAGVHNLYNLKKTYAVGASAELEFTSTGFRIYNTVAGNYKSTRLDFSEMEVVDNETYVLSADVTVTSGSGRLTVRNSANGVVAEKVATTSGHYELKFTKTSAMAYLSCFCSWEDNTIGNVTYNNVVLKRAEDTYGGYTDFALSNRELTNDRYYHAGDTVNVSLFNFSALCTNSSKDIRCTIPLSKDVSRVSNFTFKNTTSVAVRKPAGGYVIDGLLNTYTVTMLNMKDNFISFKITKTDDSAFDAPNNCCLDLAFTAGSNDSIITFS